MIVGSVNPAASLSGSAQGDALTPQRIEKKPVVKFVKSKVFPPARKKALLPGQQNLGRPDVFPATPPEYPAGYML